MFLAFCTVIPVIPSNC